MVSRIRPFSFAIDWHSGKINSYHNLIQRRLSHMKGMFFDEAAWKARLEMEDTLIYEVYEIKVPDEEGHLKGVIGFRSVLDVLAPEAG
jgi:oxalate decarboxylase/phosphoglucose isomerase-like protein (cupin superfamily)